eukprot:2960147-Rhodomonas_salina.3
MSTFQWHNSSNVKLHAKDNPSKPLSDTARIFFWKDGVGCSTQAVGSAYSGVIAMIKSFKGSLLKIPMFEDVSVELFNCLWRGDFELEDDLSSCPGEPGDTASESGALSRDLITPYQ